MLFAKELCFFIGYMIVFVFRNFVFVSYYCLFIMIVDVGLCSVFICCYAHHYVS